MVSGLMENIFNVAFLPIENNSINKRKKKFNKIGRVLTQKEIDSLIKGDLQKNLQILHSAIVSHEKVDEVNYYTNYPENKIWEGHDNFKKFAIAYNLGERYQEINDDNIKFAYPILNELSKLGFSYNPTKISAWNSLGILSKKYPEIVFLQEERLKKSLCNSNLMDCFGGLIFAENVIGFKRKKIEDIIKEAFESNLNNKNKEKYLVTNSSNALIMYFVYKHIKENVIDENNLDYNLKNFSLALKNKYNFTKKDFNEGLKKFGVDLPLWHGTPHEEVIRKTVSISKDLFPVIGAYSLREYLKDEKYLIKSDKSKIDENYFKFKNIWIPESSTKFKYNKFF